MGGRRFRYLLSLLVGVALLFALTRFLDLAHTLEEFTEYPWANLASVLGLSLAYLAVKAWRWHYYLRLLGIHIPLRRSLLVYLAGQWFAFTPAGEFVRAYILAGYGFSFSRASAAITVSLYFDLLSLAVAGSAAALVYQTLRLLVLPFTGLLILVMVAFVYAPFIIRRLLMPRRRPPYQSDRLDVDGIHIGPSPSMIGPPPSMIGPPPSMLGNSSTGAQPVGMAAPDVGTAGPNDGQMKPFASRWTYFFQYSRALLAPQPAIAGLLFGMAAVLIGTLVLQVISAGYKIEAGLGQIAFIYALSQLVGGISMLPHGLGATEGSSLAMFSYAGVDTAHAASAIVLFRLSTVGWSILVGGIALLLLRTPLAGPEHLSAAPRDRANMPDN